MGDRYRISCFSPITVYFYGCMFYPITKNATKQKVFVAKLLQNLLLSHINNRIY